MSPHRCFLKRSFELSHDCDAATEAQSSSEAVNVRCIHAHGSRCPAIADHALSRHSCPKRRRPEAPEGEVWRHRSNPVSLPPAETDSSCSLSDVGSSGRSTRAKVWSSTMYVSGVFLLLWLYQLTFHPTTRVLLYNPFEDSSVDASQWSVLLNEVAGQRGRALDSAVHSGLCREVRLALLCATVLGTQNARSSNISMWRSRGRA